MSADGEARAPTAIEIASELRRMMDENDGEVTPDFEALEGAFEAKVEAYMIVARELTAKRDRAAELAEMYAAAQDAADRQYEKLKERLHTAMRIADKDSVKTLIGNVSYRSSERVIVADGWVDDPANTQWVRVTRSAMLRELGQLAKGGGVLPDGVSIEQRKSLLLTYAGRRKR